jgi:hypothetical protein
MSPSDSDLDDFESVGKNSRCFITNTYDNGTDKAD